MTPPKSNDTSNNSGTSKASGTSKTIATSKSSDASKSNDKEPRGARRKRETRLRLLNAALRLMAARGVEGVAINEITEAADVGFGSFYNHFESKEAIYQALLDQLMEEFGEALDSATQAMTDPAEVVASCARYTILRAKQDPIWGRFLIRESLTPSALTRGLGMRIARDILRGLSLGRFVSNDPFMAGVAVSGVVLAAIAAELQFGDSGNPAAVFANSLGMPTDKIPERTATLMLQILGVPQNEASEIARRELAPFDFGVGTLD